MKCKHENADHLMPGDWRSVCDLRTGEERTVQRVTVEQFRCVDCQEWLSLGDSNDSPPEVALEVRAAELAAETWFDADKQRILDDGLDGSFEGYGWFFWNWTGARINEHVPLFQAGYLARCIATHSDEGSDA